MRLLLFSDLHCDSIRGRELVERSRHVDVVVGAGDLGNCRTGLPSTIGVLRAIQCPTVLVPGNAESFEELRDACQGWPHAHVLHGSACEFDGIPFFGVGGGIPVTPFGAWSYDFDEDQARAMLAECPAGGVLVVHSPPRGLLDQDSSGRSLGSLAIREAVDRLAPRLVVCGHIHASSGQVATHGPTTVVNAGPAGVERDL